MTGFTAQHYYGIILPAHACSSRDLQASMTMKFELCMTVEPSMDLYTFKKYIELKGMYCT